MTEAKCGPGAPWPGYALARRTRTLDRNALVFPNSVGMVDLRWAEKTFPEAVSAAQIESVDCPVAAFMVPIVCEPIEEKLAPASDSHGLGDVASRSSDLRALLADAGYETLTSFRGRKPEQVPL